VLWALPLLTIFTLPRLHHRQGVSAATEVHENIDIGLPAEVLNFKEVKFFEV